ncbi:hypothetical protein J4476_01675 [Candidatus Woesearchaeota archaeon]|nr:hypothetical protein [Candidatus Woesearchaeota archaeon]HIH26169.1 hypothetical protein [Nanoarchaeota archaeon]
MMSETHIPMPSIPKEVQEKLDAMKVKLDKFSKELVKENEDILGISLLPPAKINPEERLTKEETEKLKNRINVLVLINVETKKEWAKLRDDLIKNVQKKSKEIDENITPTVMDIAEVRENCYDAKYEILEMIGSGAPLYDPQEFLAAVKISELHKSMVLKKFDKYIVSYVAVGSLFRGEAKSFDIDVAIVIDDTDVKKMTRAELKDKLMAIIRGMGHEASQITGVKKAFHIQTYILTDFWDAIKDANPVIYTFLRDGVPIYDRGVFMPWKLLLKMGRIKPSPEAIDFQMDIGERLIQRTKGKMIGIMGDDLYYAILNPAQAALMLYGIAPPTPKETIHLMEEVFVKKEKILEKKYVDILNKIRKYYKDIEHGTLKEVTGKQIDELLKDAEDYINRIKKLFEQIQTRRDKETLQETYETCLSVVEDVLKVNEIKVKDKKQLVNLFKKHLITNKKIFTEKQLETLQLVIDTKNSKKKLSWPELEKVRREARLFIKSLVEYVQRKRGYEFERAKIRFKYGERYGEALLLENITYIIKDLDATEKEVQKAIIKADGSLGMVEKSSMEELEKEMMKINLPKKVFIKEKIFESLKKLFGSDIEILVNY